MMVFLEADFHLVVACELDESGAHELFCALVCAHANVDGFDFFKVRFQLLFCGAVGEVAWGGLLVGGDVWW